MSNFEHRLKRIADAVGDHCPCGNPQDVMIDPGETLPAQCPRCGRPAITIVVEEVVDSHEDVAKCRARDQKEEQA